MSTSNVVGIFSGIVPEGESINGRMAASLRGLADSLGNPNSCILEAFVVVRMWSDGKSNETDVRVLSHRFMPALEVRGLLDKAKDCIGTS